ncbi:unnamed protein product [Ilex paraguariensis]|uniref:F-box domain-containing protein n=1 Tax=Ilex paraguariensis TaxID=185542 RepID=A0ABC8S9N6_9AQUA
MAEWSQLPKDLLDLIAKHLDSEFDLLRFRSVCSSWRSSVLSNPFSSPSRFPILPNDGISDTTWGFYLSKRTIYRIGLPQPYPQKSWLIKLEKDNPQRMHLLNPLSKSEFKPLPSDFPKPFDLSNFRVFELGHEYTLQYINYCRPRNSISDAGNLYMEKIASSGLGIDAFVLLTIHVSGKLVMLRSGDKKWSLVDDLSPLYDDVIFYKSEFYAVDDTGQTVVVDVGLPPSVSVVAHSVFGGDKKVLVESCGNLLLVDVYLSVGPEDDLGYVEEFEFYEQFDCYISERTVRFRVFALDRSGEKWVEVESLGDRMLFLGDNCTFSASASDFPGFRGNCIFFADQFFYSGREEEGVLKSRGIGVFDLETGSIGPLADYSGYSELFWPPPAWVTSTSNTLEVGLNQLQI